MDKNEKGVRKKTAGSSKHNPEKRYFWEHVLSSLKMYFRLLFIRQIISSTIEQYAVQIVFFCDSKATTPILIRLLIQIVLSLGIYNKQCWFFLGDGSK